MDKRSLVFYLSGLAAAGAVVAIAASCSDQPRIKCTATHGPFATVYSGGLPCMPAGEEHGVEAYNDALPDKSNLDINHGHLAIAPIDLNHQIDIHPGDAGDPESSHQKYSMGKWTTSEPDPNNFCYVDPAEHDTETNLGYIPAVPGDPVDGGGAKAAVPAYSAKYHWRNVHFYATATLTGNQMVADLDLTRTVGLADGGPGEPCVGTVHVVGLWPLVDCAADDPADTDGLDETKCSPEADNSKGRPTGSGISPDLKTICHPVLHQCVLPGEPQTL